jgi:hypothetical protein
VAVSPHSDDLLAAAPKKKIPFEFVLDELADIQPWTRQMFGSTAVYVEDKIVFSLRYKPDRKDGDDGVWVATTKEHHASLRRELPNLRSIATLGVGETGWQLLPIDAADFEKSVVRACALVRAGDPRIGKVPKTKRKAQGRKARAHSGAHLRRN